MVIARPSTLQPTVELAAAPWRENGHFAEVLTNLGRMVMLQRWTVLWRENGYVMLMEGAGGGQFNGGRMVMLQRWSLMEG